VELQSGQQLTIISLNIFQLFSFIFALITDLIQTLLQMTEQHLNNLKSED